MTTYKVDKIINWKCERDIASEPSTWLLKWLFSLLSLKTDTVMVISIDLVMEKGKNPYNMGDMVFSQAGDYYTVISSRNVVDENLTIMFVRSRVPKIEMPNWLSLHLRNGVKFKDNV